MIHSVLAQMLGTYILETRTDIEMTQKKLASLAGCSEQFMGRIEKGSAMPPERILINCICILDLKYEKLRKIYRISSDAHFEKLYSHVSRKQKAQGG